jgi:hypothetical protein
MLESIKNENDLLASLSTQSLNRLADKLSKAEALSAEIALIINGLPTKSWQTGRQELSPPATKRKHGRPATVRT